MKENATKGIPLKRLGTPEEIDELVTYLLTSKADYINGEVIHGSLFECTRLISSYIINTIF